VHVILATSEAEIGRFKVQIALEIVPETPSPK
jgi:hypothetical protein